MVLARFSIFSARFSIVLDRFSIVLRRFPMGFARFSVVLPMLPSYGFTKDFRWF